ncbi:TPA: hypothetical protein TZW69_000113 [Streptococcus suis]|uniref:hypothetical protein n=1 Tax=Streptococcus suis TaxID=1307 RepID=UPI0005BE96F5|nr:hypothetical protein [Streptococcus suis]NQH41542.1 hypothetical protein [Streptococcus suis]NQH56410.1 hypothetical protein [Streptococcus suis]NQO52929.1 hypothetical protein [Streptococcus suis]CYU97117.1 Uncharacterised protein [Streptococcus suis]CYV28528.1 Uncharacterised protein [Streptococcus suis]
MTEELMLTTEQGLILIAVLTVILVWLIRKPMKIEIEVNEPAIEEKQPERNLRYLQIHRYYGG